jgi:hypothetical protein
LNQRDIERERDRILKADGFDDIENTGAFSGIKSPANPERHVHRPEDLGVGGESFRRHAHETEEYYRRAAHFLWEHEWYDEASRRCWELHADGASYTRIVRTMKREGHTTIYRRRVHKLVTELREDMLSSERAAKRGRGRPRQEDSLTAQDMRLDVLLSPGAAMAMDHIVKFQGVSRSEAVRRALVLMARTTR